MGYPFLQSRSDPSPSPLSSQSSPLCIRLDILNVFTISSIHSNLFPPCLSAISAFVLVSISSMSSLQYRWYALIHPSSLPPFSPHFCQQFSTFITSPSSMYPRTPFPSTFNTSQGPSGSIHISQCRLLCPYVPNTDVCVTVLDTSIISSSSFSPFQPSPLCNCSTCTSNPCSQCNSILFPPSPLPSPPSPSLRPFILSPALTDILTFICGWRLMGSFKPGLMRDSDVVPHL